MLATFATLDLLHFLRLLLLLLFLLRRLHLHATCCICGTCYTTFDMLATFLTLDLDLLHLLRLLLLLLCLQRRVHLPRLLRLLHLIPSWLSDQILRAIKERDRLKKEMEKGRIQKVSFNAARNKVVRLIEKAKKEAVINEIDNSKLNSRILWKTLKSIFLTSVRQLSRINSVTKDGTSYTTPEEISNVFNEHFISNADKIIF